MHSSRNPAYIRSLQYFEAVARHRSMLGASRELGVSPSAVSHQMRDLSRMVGEDLYERSGRGIVLTPAGEMLAARISSTFEELNATLGDLVGGETKVVRVAVCSAFGPHWLVPRLARFHARHPETRLEIRLYSEHPEQSQATADCIVTARGVKRGYLATPLFDETLVAVEAGWATNGPTPPLITTDCAPGRELADWHLYARQTGLPFDDIARAGSTGCTHYLLAAAMAEAGLGVALVPHFLAAEALAAGRLRLRYKKGASSGRTYQVCFKEARANDIRLRQITRWMQREADESSARADD